MTTEELVNLALFKIGVSNSITDIEDTTSREAVTAKAVYNTTLRATLRHFPWAFATKYADLLLVQGPVPSDDSLVQAWSAADTYAIGDVVDLSGTRYYATVAGLSHTPPNTSFWSTDPTTQANGDWTYAYRWPADCLFARRIVPDTGRLYNATPLPYRVGRDVNGLLVYAKQPDAELEYTCLECDALWTDDLFIDTFTWRLGAALAPSLSQLPNAAILCQQMYTRTLDTATAVSSREQQQEKDGDASWIEGRS